MFDLRQLNVQQVLDKLVSSGVAGGLAGGVAGGALTSLLLGKGGRKLAGTALQVGGLALLGGLAYKAWQGWQQSKQGGAAAAPAAGAIPVPPPASGFLPDPGDRPAQAALGLLLLRAMIAAAKADGQIDADESRRIFAEINRLELSAADKGALLEEYARPLDLDALVAAVDSAAHAAEVYAASVLVIADQTPAERAYLERLAQRLRLDPALAQEIARTVAGARASATVPA